jgi:hypothetical protein
MKAELFFIFLILQFSHTSLNVGPSQAIKENVLRVFVWGLGHGYAYEYWYMEFGSLSLFFDLRAWL